LEAEERCLQSFCASEYIQSSMPRHGVERVSL